MLWSVSLKTVSVTSVIQISIHSEETDSEEESDLGEDISVKTYVQTNISAYLLW